MHLLDTGIGFLAAGDALVGAYTLYKNPGRSLNRIFALFGFSTALLAAGMAFLFESHDFRFNDVVFAGGYLMTLSVVLLTLKFPNDPPFPRWTWLAFLPLGSLAAATPFGFVIKALKESAGGGLEPVNGPGMPVFTFVIAAYLALGAWNIQKRYKALSGRSRMQMQYFILAVGTFVIATFICNVLLPLFGIFSFNLIGPASSLVFLMVTSYAIVRHRLLDIRVVIQRGVIYLILATLLIGIYTTLVLLVGDFLYRTIDDDVAALVSGAITTCAGILTVPIVERYFRRLTDNFFFKDSYDYPHALQKLSAILARNLDTAKIVSRSSFALRSVLKTNVARVIIFDEAATSSTPPSWKVALQALSRVYRSGIALASIPEEKSVLAVSVAALIEQLRKKYHLEAVAPIVVENKVIGAVALGPKLSGDPYREEDLRLITTFAHQAAVALEKAKLFGEVKRHAAELEGRVQERTAEILRLQEEQREMMMDISHRLQTPLAVIKAELESWRHGSDPSLRIDVLERSVSGISKFIYDILNLARLGTLKDRIPKERFDLSQIVEELVEYFEVMANDKRIAFSANIDPSVEIIGNREYLEELVTNLVSNAFKYLDPDRSQKVEISLASKGSRSLLCVSDSGKGISSEDLENIFDRFYRGKQRIGEVAAGTGLGLAISKRIVQSHGGTIAIESELGRGTTVRVELPND